MKEIFRIDFPYTYGGKRNISFSNMLTLEENEYNDFINCKKEDITNCVNIYIDKKIKINRNKLRDTGFKIVRDVSKADMILFNIDDYLDRNYRSLIEHDLGMFNDLDHFINLNPNLIINSENQEILRSLIKENKKTCSFTYHSRHIDYPTNIDFEYISKYIILEKDLNYIKTIYFYRDKLINVDLLYKNRNEEIILDKELYNNLKSLFKSNDRENNVVALQTLTNCNYIKSAPYILKLLFDHERTIFELREKNHVNFKSLLTFFNIHRLYNTSSTIDNCIQKLESKNLMTLENLQILIDLYGEHKYNIVGSNYLGISELKLTNNAIRSILKSEKESSLSTVDEDYLKKFSLNYDLTQDNIDNDDE